MIVNKYVINSKIGKGQFGQIYKGKYKKTNEDIAIKFELVDSEIITEFKEIMGSNSQ